MKPELELDISQFSKELSLILLLINLEKNKGSISEYSELVKDINWGQFLKLVKHHRIYPIIYKRVKEMNKDLIPPFVVEVLNQEYKNNRFRMLQLSGETVLVSRLLAENKIRTLFLKGPVLGVDLYGDISLRTSSDLDVMVDMQDLERVEGILLSEGYVKDDYIVSVLNDWKWRHHHFSYFHPMKKIKLEIHWRLNPGPSKEPTFNDLWARRMTSALSSYPVFTLGNDDLFLFLVLHGARHGWSRIRWLVDIDQLVSRIRDWDKVITILKKYHSTFVGGQALVLASKIFNTPINNNMKQLVSGKRPFTLAQEAVFYIKKMVNLHSDELSEEVAKYHSRHLFSLMSLQQKTLFLLSFLYPYHIDAETLPLPKYLHFLYFPLRPFLFLWRKMKKQAPIRL